MERILRKHEREREYEYQDLEHSRESPREPNAYAHAVGIVLWARAEIRHSETHSNELLGFEERAQVARLPEADQQQRRNLHDAPPEHTRRSGLTEMAEALLALLCHND